MATLVRSDGVQFIIQAYRETISAMRKSLLVHKTRLLAEQQGQYITITRKEKDQFEIVLSKEPGFLLGEMVRQHFNNEKNIIFCEQLPEQTDIILVVIRNGSVLLEAKVDLSSLYDELLPFLVTGEPFHFYISDSIPLTIDTSQSEKILLPEKAVSQLTEFSTPVFSTLKPLPEFQLTSLPLALKNIKMQGGPEITVLYVLAGLLFVGILWWIFKPADKTTTLPVKTAIAPASMYDIYRRAMAAPEPNQVMNELVAVLEDLFFAPGWDLTSLQFTGSTYQAVYTSQSGSVEVLSDWAKKNNYQFLLNSYGAQITVNSLLAARPAPTSIYSTDQVTELLIDQFTSLLGQNGVQLGNETIQGKLKQRLLTLQFNGASPEMLTVAGNELKDLPVVVQSIQLNVSNGLVSGNVQISIWGT